MEVTGRRNDIQPLADFQRDPQASIAKLKRSGRAAEADHLTALRRSIVECRENRVRSLDTALDELETQHLGPKQSDRTERSAHPETPP